MTPTGAGVTTENDPPRFGSIWLAIPSWLISLLLHAGMLATFAMTFHQSRTIGDPDADARQVGIYYRSVAKGPPGLPGAPGDGSVGAPLAQALAAAAGSGQSIDDLKVDETPPVEIDLPTFASPRIGPETGLTVEAAPRDARQMIKSTGSSSGAGKGGGGVGGAVGAGGGAGGGGGGGGGGGDGSGGRGSGTTFFGQRATGARFLYLLDASGSMQDYNALGVAKAELLASLAQLDADQQFQIIFYSEHCYPMVNTDGRSHFFAATDINRTTARQFVRGISPLEGTRHLEALLMALSYNPDVIFFLTDAGEPKLYPADLERIKKRNTEKAQIHTIEFGKHANLNIDSNFLKKLARENRGGYVYRDITQFRKE